MTKNMNGEIEWNNLCRRLYFSIEDSLIEINHFRRYKDRVCLMSDEECIDLFRGVVLYYYIAKMRGDDEKVPTNLFESVYDWHRLKFATQRIVYVSSLYNSENIYERETKLLKIIHNEQIKYDVITANLISFMLKYNN